MHNFSLIISKENKRDKICLSMDFWDDCLYIHINISVFTHTHLYIYTHIQRHLKTFMRNGYHEKAWISDFLFAPK